MDIRKLQRAIVDGLQDVKAQNIAVFNTEQLTPLFERVIIASGTSNRQTKALAASVRDAVKATGHPVMRTEGEDNGEWIIVDCGAAVAHIMQPGARDYYHLEEIWGSKPVRMKIEQSAAPGPLPRPAAVKKKPAARKPSDGAASAKKKPAAAPRGVTRSVGVKGTAGKTPAGRPARKARPASKSSRTRG